MENNEQKDELKANEAVAADAPENQNENVSENAEQDNETNLLLKTQAELAEQKDKFLRLYSEFENFRRRTAREKLDMIQSANEQVIKALLPVIDDAERAEKLSSGSKDMEGAILIFNKLKKVVEQFGVKPMDLKTGADFNADLHEAITQIPAPDESLKGKVVDVIEKGYVLNEKVVRFAKVVVGS